MQFKPTLQSSSFELSTSQLGYQPTSRSTPPRVRSGLERLASGPCRQKHAGVQDPLRIQTILYPLQRRGKKVRTLTTVPWHVVASDRVVMRHCSAMGDHCVKRATLDFQPLLRERAVPPLCLKREIRRRPIRIAMGKAAGHAALLAGSLETGVLSRRKNRRVKRGEPLPGDRGLEGIGDDAHLHDGLLVVRHADKGIAPGFGSAGAVAATALCNVTIEVAAE